MKVLEASCLVKSVSCPQLGSAYLKILTAPIRFICAHAHIVIKMFDIASLQRDRENHEFFFCYVVLFVLFLVLFDSVYSVLRKCLS